MKLNHNMRTFRKVKITWPELGKKTRLFMKKYSGKFTRDWQIELSYRLKEYNILEINTFLT